MTRTKALIPICSLLIFILIAPAHSNAFCTSNCSSVSIKDKDFSFLDTMGGIEIAQAVLDTTEVEEPEEDGSGTEVDIEAEDRDSLLLEAAKYASRQNGAASSAKEWEAFMAVYFWLSGLNGNIGVGNTTADVDASFSDIWKNFDVGVQLHLELWYKRWLLFLDPSYVILSNTNNQTINSIPVKTNSTVKQFIFDIAGGYRVAEIPLSSSPKNHNGNIWPELDVDLYGGGRIYSIDSKVNLTLDTPAGPVKESFSKDESWFDFIVGTRFIFNLTEDLLFTTKTDIGGFGLGFSSDISWNFVANIGYELPWMGITPYIGYRVLYVDYKDGSGDNRFVYDVWQTGPQIGLGVQF